MTRRNRASDLRGGSRLAIEATVAVADLVQAMHRRIAGPFAVLAAPAYGGVRGVASLVGAGLDAALARVVPLTDAAPASPEREALVAALNGVLGDHLEATGNPLAIRMALRRAGHPIALESGAIARAIPGAGGRILVAIHGSSLSDLQWRRAGHDHAEKLAALGYAPVYLHYNSGLHVSVNGRALARLLERLVDAWPTPVTELSLLGHSMGGLVARSACSIGAESGHRWLALLRNLVCLGSPHHGAPLERYGNLL
ncbi:MAG TPA: alpha/beta hydrolase, partial [Anaeromyxobacteraceae bacterium]|nr:alpha/beta hydrolase [Anaeromyxobacteraceae bacterium]